VVTFHVNYLGKFGPRSNWPNTISLLVVSLLVLRLCSFCFLQFCSASRCLSLGLQDWPCFLALLNYFVSDFFITVPAVWMLTCTLRFAINNMYFICIFTWPPESMEQTGEKWSLGRWWRVTDGKEKTKFCKLLCISTFLPWSYYMAAPLYTPPIGPRGT
jgi:hypothetical protein